MKQEILYFGKVILKCGTFLVAIAGLAALAQESTGGTCENCHEKVTPGIVGQWRASRHFGAGVSCLDCHQAAVTDSDGFIHNGQRIAIIVSPKDCSQCHEDEYLQQRGSHHAKAAEILGSLDNILGEIMGGEPAVVIGCRQCHGSVVRVDSNGRPTPESWPNTGMGRINPDGSDGSCSACHARHAFSIAQARQPEACGKCHLGPDHPQIEVWNESKHGVLYHANREQLKLDSRPWRAGVEYFSGPTCSSCHISAAGTQQVTHDVGERISWSLRPVVSVKLNMVVYEDNTKDDIPGDDVPLPEVGSARKGVSGEVGKVKAVLSWKERRIRMQDVCSQCHEKSFVQGAYSQFDDLVNLYDDKFGRPGKAIMDELKKAGKITTEDFDDPIEWTWYEIWHHEGRRGRHGAAMQGPDYAWWHGMYEVAKGFYMDFIPQMEQVAGREMADSLLNKYIYTQPGHTWFRDGLGKEALEKIRQFYEKRYGE